MAARFFTPDYIERAVLHDGTHVVVRLLAPDDKELLRRGFERLSWESRYTRFLVPKERLTDDELHYLCDIDQEHHFAIGAVREDGDGQGNAVGLGIARFIRLPDRPGQPVTAEAAIAVADEEQGQGLGRLLFLRLVAAAAERGIERFRCEVLGTNATMATLIDKIAPGHSTVVESGVMSIDFPLPAVSPDESPAAPPPSDALYQFFRAAAEGLIEWSDSVVHFWRRRSP